MIAVLWSDPRIPNRSKGYAKLGPDPLPWMLNGVDHLVAMGAKAIVIPCNTAHLWYEEFAAATLRPDQDIPIVDSIDALALAAMAWYCSSGA